MIICNSGSNLLFRIRVRDRSTFLFWACNGMHLQTLNNKAVCLWCALHVKRIWTGGMLEEIYKMHIRRFVLSTRLKRRQSISQQNSISPYHNRDSMTYMPGRISVCRVLCVIRFFHTSESHVLHVT